MRSHEPLPEAPPEGALVIMARGDADGRRIQADEQEATTRRRQVCEGVHGRASDGQRDPMAARTGTVKELFEARGQLVGPSGGSAGPLPLCTSSISFRASLTPRPSMLPI